MIKRWVRFVGKHPSLWTAENSIHLLRQIIEMLRRDPELVLESIELGSEYDGL